MERPNSRPDAAEQRPRFSSFTMVLPVNDEEARVERALAYYRRFARILVVDNASRDRSAELARAAGVDVVEYRNAGTIQTPEWMRHVSGLLETDHFVLLSCSEFIPESLLECFDEVARARSADVVSCARVHYTCGEEIPLWGRRENGRKVLWAERFFDRTGLDFDGVVIHQPFPAADPARLLVLPAEPRYTMVHLRDSDALSLVRKHAEYASVEARDRVARGRRTGFAWLLKTCVLELANFVRLPLSSWNRLALREVWGRIVMHSVTHWVAWELRQGRGMDYARRRSDELWQAMVRAQGDAGTAGRSRK